MPRLLLCPMRTFRSLMFCALAQYLRDTDVYLSDTIAVRDAALKAFMRTARGDWGAEYGRAGMSRVTNR